MSLHIERTCIVTCANKNCLHGLERRMPTVLRWSANEGEVDLFKIPQEAWGLISVGLFEGPPSWVCCKSCAKQYIDQVAIPLSPMQKQARDTAERQIAEAKKQVVDMGSYKAPTEPEEG